MGSEDVVTFVGLLNQAEVRFNNGLFQNAIALIIRSTTIRMNIHLNLCFFGLIVAIDSISFAMFFGEYNILSGFLEFAVGILFTSFYCFIKGKV